MAYLSPNPIVFLLLIGQSMCNFQMILHDCCRSDMHTAIESAAPVYGKMTPNGEKLECLWLSKIGGLSIMDFFFAILKPLFGD